jgi:dihydroorotate dehydrogenase
MSFLWEKILRPAAFALDAERAHEMGISALSNGFASPFYARDNTFGMEPVEVFGLKFPNPIGLAAGFDKNGLVANELASLGFGFVEVGTVTAEPQPGNPKPRMFRLPQDQALINRLGFNNDGAAAVAERLRTIKRECVVGVNIGKNKDVPNERATESYVAAFEAVQAAADYVAVNISSPNTPGLRELQQDRYLDELLGELQRPPEGGTQSTRKPLLVKIAPDLSYADIEMIVDVCLSKGVAGIIATNTTVNRSGLRTPVTAELEQGGLSGRPLAKRSNEVISRIYRHADGKLPIIGVGGVFTAQDAFDKIAAGASLVQAYTGFVYGGPTFAADVCRALAKILNERGFNSVSEAVGTGVQ